MPAYPYRARALLKYSTPPGQPAFKFPAGAELTVLGAADDDGDWLEGELVGGAEGAKGVFPASFVEPLAGTAAVEEAGEGNKEAQPARETVNNTPMDKTNVVEGSEATPAAVSVQPDEITSAPTASTEVSDGQSTARSPTSPMEKPTLKDVTPAAAPVPPPAEPSAVPSQPQEPAKATPPPPAKKPNALASRIAAFNAAATAQKSEPPPIPRAKPREWKPRPPAESPAPAPTPVAVATPAAAASADGPTPVSEPVRASSNDEAATGEAKDFSAQDAAASISRGGGSLRDRIKLLQGGGGGAGVRVDAPPPPGHAPKPKPWRRAEPEADAEGQPEEEDASVKEAHALEDVVVKDQKPGEEETTAQSPGAEVPGFEPAEASPEDSVADDADETSEGEPADAAAREMVDRTPKDPTNVVEGSESTPAAASIVESAEDDKRPRGASDTVKQPTLADVTPASPTADTEAGEDDEAAKRAALAQRMAGLGGQRMGVPMPALPKRAAGPRARKAKSPSGEVPPPPAEAAPVEEDKASQPSQERAAGTDVLASMGGASALLVQGDDDDEPSKAPPADEDDFDIPAPPARVAAPPAPAAPAAPDEAATRDQPAEFEEPPLEADEEPLAAEEYAQRDEPGDEDKPTIAEEAVAALPESAATDDGEWLSPAAPQAPSRPPLPPPFVRQETDAPRPGPPTADVPTSGLTPRTPPPPSRVVDPAPAFASGAETITDEPRPIAHAPEPALSAKGEHAPPPLPRGRPPVPSALQQRAEDNDEEGSAPRPQHPPIPTHPPPTGAGRVTTAAEDKLIASMPEIVTPPEEAFDESSAAPELDAPTTGTIAQGRVQGGHETADMGQPAWGKVEGTQTPAVEREQPEPLVPGAPPPPAMLSAALGAVQVEQGGERAGEARQAQAGGEGEEGEEEEEEEEDPEVERRRALAARMAKLGGRGMMPPMFGGFGGAMGGPKKAPKKKQTNELAEEGELRPKLDSQPVEPESGPDEAVAAHPPRRIGGIPSGGFALPGIASARPPPQEREPEESSGQAAVDDEVLPGEPLAHADRLKAESDAATDEAFECHSASSHGDHTEARDEDEPQQDAQAPPPLPPSRPSTLPPRRSVPVPPPAGEHELAHAHANKPERVLQEGEAHVDEPESFERGETEAEDASELPPPPPPPRPAGGHQGSLPLSPTHAVPSSPPLPMPQSPNLSGELARTATQTSRRSSAFAAPSPRGSFDVDRSHGSAPIKANLDSLLQWSASLGAQVFAAAHAKASDKAARGLSDRDLLEFCYGRATDPLPPAGGTYGAKVFEATVEQGKKASSVTEEDEPRAGDIVAIHAKFKHNLTSKTVGSTSAPHTAVVAGWDAKKGKLRVIEVDGKSGAVDEGSYRVDEMRAGQLSVYRVVPREYV